MEASRAAPLADLGDSLLPVALADQCLLLAVYSELAPTYQIWAAPLVCVTIAILGLAYLALAHPHETITRGVA